MSLTGASEPMWQYCVASSPWWQDTTSMATRGGSPVVINNIDNSQSNPTISNQATTVKVPDAVRSGESTFGFTAAAMMS